ncbi:Class I glutamine amidotransferase-like superfamily protein [Theobroma cacao]|uniref:Class I glutamine amidotransferase-like superfamily protein n=1 Tax=Theobroma cacao TaxID=3641 RepID=A0A061DR76_THECC|nr:Class I glutamine amidotransferase-like superfamily protein [Theobroma cacao]
MNMMGSVAKKSALIICGDYMEDFEVMVPFHVLQAFGVRVDCVSPTKLPGDKCITAIHDFLGFELYTELPGHSFTLNSNFDEVEAGSYDALIIPGGRFIERLSVDDEVLSIVRRFAEAGKPIATSCHSQLLLAAAGLLKGKKCTAFASMKSVIELAGGVWWEQPGITSVFDITACLKDGNILSSIGWPAHAEYLKVLFKSIGAKIHTAWSNSVLFICGDYVEDYEINVPFRALQALGCKVDAVTPSKKRGETCVTAIHDDEGAQVFSEKRGHNFFITANWDDISVHRYDCIVVPGGRSPELLVMNEKVVNLVKEFAEKDKVIAGIGQGQWLLAAAGIVKGKRCATNNGMKVMVKMAGGDLEESKGCVSDGKLVTAAGWPDLPAFISELSKLLGLSLSFE